MNVVGCVCARNFGMKFFFRRGECKFRANSNFRKNGQNRHFGQNPEFFYISDDETDFTVGIISRNLATTSNFVEFRDNQNLHVFRDT